MNCTACAPGRYSLPAQHNCTSCAPGSWTSVYASDGCTACDLGRYSAEVGATNSDVCTICGVGQIAIAPNGSGACELCPIGTYNTELGLDASFHDEVADCLDCSEGRFSSSNRVSCEACTGGQYVFNQESCEECTKGKVRQKGGCRTSGSRLGLPFHSTLINTDQNSTDLLTNDG